MSNTVRLDHPEAGARLHAQEDRGWVRVSCAVADLVRNSNLITVTSSLTDLTGDFGEPKVHTVWGLRGNGGDVLDEYRWPGNDGWPGADGPGDRYRCEHYAPGRSA